MSDFELTRATSLARASAAAYGESAEAIKESISADVVETFSTRTTFGFVARSGPQIIVAFRGTVSLLSEPEQSLLQWLVNLDFIQTESMGGRVHRGFLAALESVWPAISGILDRLCNSGEDSLWLTGHSLGGALATLAGARLSSEGRNPAGIYTFGAPCVGDDSFANGYRAVLHRIEHANDIVCHLPLPPALVEILGKISGSVPAAQSYIFRPIGTLTFLDEVGNRQTLKSPSELLQLAAYRLGKLTAAAGRNELKCFLQDHGIEAYLTKLQMTKLSVDSDIRSFSKGILKALLDEVKREGPVLLSKVTRKAVAFLQETSGYRRLLESPNAGGIVMGADDLAATIRQYGKKDVVDMLNSLQMLGASTVAASVVGIGINVAGFAMVLNRLNQVATVANAAKEEALAARFVAERLDLREVIRNRARVLTYLELAERALKSKDPAKRLAELQNPMFEQLNYEKCLLGMEGACSILLDHHFAFDEAVSAYESVLHLDTACFQGLLLTAEDEVALHHCQEFQKWHARALLGIRPDAMAAATSRQVARVMGISEADAGADLRIRATSFKAQVREIDRHAAHRTSLMKYLLAHGIRGRDYLEAARNTEETPFLVMPISA